ELARSSVDVRRAVARNVGARLRRLSRAMPGSTARRRHDAATLLIAMLVGTMLLSRLLPDEEGERALVVTRRVIGRAARRARVSGAVRRGRSTRAHRGSRVSS